MKILKVLLALSVVVNLWFAYHMVDVGSAMTDAYSEQTTIRRDARACMKILGPGWVGRPERDVLALPEVLKAQGVPADDLYVKQEPAGTTVLGLTFELANGKVRAVKYYGNSADYDRDLDPPQAARNAGRR